jgi:hypothetical protein
MSYAYKNLKSHQNQSSGLAEQILIAPMSWITEPAVPTAPFTNPGDEVTVKTAHTFAATKGFTKHQLAPQKAKLDIKTKGELGANGHSQELEVFIPGSYAQAHEQMKKWMNTPLMAMIKDANPGSKMYYQLGYDENLAAWLVPDFMTATTKDGIKGFTVKITYDDGALLYDATTNEPTILAD